MKKRNKISIYVRNKDINPSGYYRLAQYFDVLNDQYIIKYRELVGNRIYKSYYFKNSILSKILYILSIYFKSLWFLISDSILFKPDIVIIGREICPRRSSPLRYSLEKALLKRTHCIWDFDDAINISREISIKEWDLLQKYSHKIILLNDYLQNFIKNDYKNKCYLLPTTDGDYVKLSHDTVEFKRAQAYLTEVHLVWIGTSSNLKYLANVIAYIDAAAKILWQKNSKKTILRCVCNKPLIIDTKFLTIENIIWDRNVALKQMEWAHIGLMPLEDNEFTRGKGGFKLIQYLSAGLPVIGASVGFNKSIIKESFGFLVTDDWLNAIIDISLQQDNWLKMSNEAKREWYNKYAFDSNLKFWKDVIND